LFTALLCLRENLEGCAVGRSCPLSLILTLFLLGAAADARAQYFGRNKVQYDQDAVRVLATDHFDIYYSRDDAEAALVVGRLAERWHRRLSRVLEHTLTGRQPLILYGSHRRFEQTNVFSGLIDENTGGFTESRKRRIVIPFGATFAETDHVLGHEIVHAFQYDIAAHSKSPLAVPLWFVEGMAEYLSLGPGDPLTAMWMRDAVRSEKLPSIRGLSNPKLFPYRWGAALWAFLAERYGADLPARTLRARKSIDKRLHETTGESIDTLTKEWHESLRETYSGPAATAAPAAVPVISSRRGGGRLNLAASISPDGTRMIFLSERDQFSIDLFLADATTGNIVRKLITTAANTDFESLQYLHSAGAWDPSGKRFALATIRNGRPAITILDIADGSAPREIPLDRLDEVYSPTWAPDAHAMAFAGLKGGVTDLYSVDLASGDVAQLTHDQYADLQPAWSPDGHSIAFTTDRFTSDVTMLRFGGYRIGIFDLASGAVSEAPGMGTADQVDPAWSADGASLYFVGARDGIPNVFRADRADGRTYQVTNVGTGVSGVTQLSPALSIASRTGTLAYSTYKDSAYEIHTIRDPSGLAGTQVIQTHTAPATRAAVDEPDHIDPVPPLQAAPKPSFTEKGYRPHLSLEAVGSPYFSAGGGSFGNYVQGGASLLFGDLLGDRQLLTALHLNSRFDESSFGTMFVDRTSRWSWGLTAEQAPEVLLRTTAVRSDPSRDGALTRDYERQVWTHRHLSGFVAYPLNRSQRIELSAGARQISFNRQGRTQVFSPQTGKLLQQEELALPDEPSIGIGEAGAAFVGDTAVFGATGPLLGSRYRFQIAPAMGGLTYTSVLADYRRYFMPIRPYTLAFRLVHSGRYGSDSDDPRLLDAYVGSSSLVRGYGASAVAHSQCGAGSSRCSALYELVGTRYAVAKAELRIPVMGLRSSRVRYGPLPIDGFLFADAGAAWGGRERMSLGPVPSTRLVRSVGAGIRLNAVGLIFELATARPLDLDHAGWTFGFNLRPAF
jgi:Tol biopolymer transport system component